MKIITFDFTIEMEVEDEDFTEDFRKEVLEQIESAINRELIGIPCGDFSLMSDYEF